MNTQSNIVSGARNIPQIDHLFTLPQNVARRICILMIWKDYGNKLFIFSLQNIVLILSYPTTDFLSFSIIVYHNKFLNYGVTRSLSHNHAIIWISSEIDRRSSWVIVYSFDPYIQDSYYFSSSNPCDESWRRCHIRSHFNRDSDWIGTSRISCQSTEIPWRIGHRETENNFTACNDSCSGHTDCCNSINPSRFERRIAHKSCRKKYGGTFSSYNVTKIIFFFSKKWWRTN